MWGMNNLLNNRFLLFIAYEKIGFYYATCDKNSLVIIDEICSGTDPKEGESLAEAMLTYLHKKRCLYFSFYSLQCIKRICERIRLY